MWPDRLTLFPRLRHTATNTLTALGLFLLIFLGAKAIGQIRSDTLVKGLPRLEVPLQQDSVAFAAPSEPPLQTGLATAKAPSISQSDTKPDKSQKVKPGQTNNGSAKVATGKPSRH